jgi:hypothetical protein
MKEVLLVFHFNNDCQRFFSSSFMKVITVLKIDQTHRKYKAVTHETVYSECFLLCLFPFSNSREFQGVSWVVTKPWAMWILRAIRPRPVGFLLAAWWTSCVTLVLFWRCTDSVATGLRFRFPSNRLWRGGYRHLIIDILKAVQSPYKPSEKAFQKCCSNNGL